MNTKNSIFTSGGAKREIKIDLTLKSQIFCFFYALKLQKLSLFQCVSNHNSETVSFVVVLHQI